MTVESDYALTSGRAVAPARTADAAAPSLPAPTRRPWLRGMRARDAVFQKLLVRADLLSAAAGITALAVFGGHGLPLASLWTLPLIIVFAKITGRLAPGITGPWQVVGPARPPLSEMVKTDYLYAVNGRSGPT
jgi:hypothetical protein